MEKRRRWVFLSASPGCFLQPGHRIPDLGQPQQPELSGQLAPAKSAPKIFPNLTQSPHTSPFLGLRPPQLSELQWKGQGQASTVSLHSDWHESSIISCPVLLPRCHTVGVSVSCCVPFSDTQNSPCVIPSGLFSLGLGLPETELTSGGSGRLASHSHSCQGLVSHFLSHPNPCCSPRCPSSAPSQAHLLAIQ